MVLIQANSKRAIRQTLGVTLLMIRKSSTKHKQTNKEKKRKKKGLIQTKILDKYEVGHQRTFAKLD